tara:strand:+ start:1878 stop:2258 length:381 start_codon:yes stop_codon:yes gene_type:complete
MKKVAENATIEVMENHIYALNNLDEERLIKTLHFPHYRLAGTRLTCWHTSERYLADFRERAGDRWASSKWNTMYVQRSSNDKVHLLVEVIRLDNYYKVITSFESLWVITQQEQKWAALFRSSFAES